MAHFSIRPVQQITEQGFADFCVDAPTAEAAAEIVRQVYKIAQAEGSNVVKLLDGQVQVLERSEIMNRDVRYILLDGDGEELGAVGVQHRHLPREALS